MVSVDDYVVLPLRRRSGKDAADAPTRALFRPRLIACVVAVFLVLNKATPLWGAFAGANSFANSKEHLGIPVCPLPGSSLPHDHSEAHNQGACIP